MMVAHSLDRYFLLVFFLNYLASENISDIINIILQILRLFVVKKVLSVYLIM